ncbi:MAG: endolytic transglycosylase MltG, partial [Gammaproteobacteria bacterium]
MIWRVLKLTTSLLFIGIVLTAFWFYQDYKAYQEVSLSVPEQGYVLHVKKGMTLTGIARKLSQQGITDKPKYLVLLGRQLKLDSSIKTGEFELQPDLLPVDLLTLLNKGKVIQHSLTIIEGQRFRDMLKSLWANADIENTLQGLSDNQIMTELQHPDEKPEGRFLADTYFFTRGATDRELLQRAYTAMQQYLQKAWAEKSSDLPLKSPYEALILASIIEKETAIADERPRISGVFVRRLNKGMRLETDPTVIYGLGDAYDGDIRYKDLRTDTP